MRVSAFVAAFASLGVGLPACSTSPNDLRPDSCADTPARGVTSNAPHDGTRGASGVSSTSNGTGSTIDPTAPDCH
jgi:hypothetical protein